LQAKHICLPASLAGYRKQLGGILGSPVHIKRKGSCCGSQYWYRFAIGYSSNPNIISRAAQERFVVVCVFVECITLAPLARTTLVPWWWAIRPPLGLVAVDILPVVLHCGENNACRASLFTPFLLLRARILGSDFETLRIIWPQYYIVTRLLASVVRVLCVTVFYGNIWYILSRRPMAPQNHSNPNPLHWLKSLDLEAAQSAKK